MISRSRLWANVKCVVTTLYSAIKMGFFDKIDNVSVLHRRSGKMFVTSEWTVWTSRAAYSGAVTICPCKRLTVRPLNGSLVSHVMGLLPDNFQLAIRPSVLDLGSDKQTNRQTDRQRSSMHYFGASDSARRIRFSSDADIVRLTNARIIILLLLLFPHPMGRRHNK